MNKLFFISFLCIGLSINASQNRPRSQSTFHKTPPLQDTLARSLSEPGYKPSGSLVDDLWEVRPTVEDLGAYLDAKQQARTGKTMPAYIGARMAAAEAFVTGKSSPNIVIITTEKTSRETTPVTIHSNPAAAEIESPEELPFLGKKKKKKNKKPVTITPSEDTTLATDQ